MRWLPSTRMGYTWLGVGVLSLVALLDGLARSAAGQGLVGVAIVVAACFGVVFAWLLVEPLIDEALVKARERQKICPIGDQARMERLLGEVASAAGMRAPRLRVYESDEVGVMVVGLGRSATLFVNDGVNKMTDRQLTGIVAHELGHVRCGHWICRLALYGGLLSLAMLLSAGGVLVPVLNLGVLWVMRRMEFSADRAAAAMVGAGPIVDALKSLGCVGEEGKRWVAWFSTHPLVSDRISRLTSFR